MAFGPSVLQRRGRRPASASYGGWDGGIDEIAFYDRPLDAATIDAHARAGDDGAPPVARADPPPAALQSRSGVIHLTSDRAGSSFRCSLDGARYAPLPAATTRCEASPTARTSCACWRRAARAWRRSTPTVLRFAVDAQRAGHVAGAAARAGRRRARDRDVRLGLADRLRVSRPRRPGSAPTPTSRRAGRRWTSRRARPSRCARSTPPATAIRRRRSSSVPPAGKGFSLGPTLPTFAGARAEARAVGRVGGTRRATSARSTPATGPRARQRSGCRSSIRARTRMQVRQQFARRRAVRDDAADGRGRVAPRPGDVAIAGLQMQLVIERSARLLRRAPRVRFALSHPAAVTVDVLRRGRAPRSASRRGHDRREPREDLRAQAQRACARAATRCASRRAARPAGRPCSGCRWRSCRRCGESAPRRARGGCGARGSLGRRLGGAGARGA